MFAQTSLRELQFTAQQSVDNVDIYSRVQRTNSTKTKGLELNPQPSDA